MPQKCQKSVTLDKELVESIEGIANKNDRSVANIITLTIQKEFGSKNIKAMAEDVLGSLIR